MDALQTGTSLAKNTHCRFDVDYMPVSDICAQHFTTVLQQPYHIMSEPLTTKCTCLSSHPRSKLATTLTCARAHLAAAVLDVVVVPEVGVDLDLVHGRLDARVAQQVLDLLDREVADADVLHQALVDQLLHRLPKQADAPGAPCPVSSGSTAFCATALCV